MLQVLGKEAVAAVELIQRDILENPAGAVTPRHRLIQSSLPANRSTQQQQQQLGPTGFNCAVHISWCCWNSMSDPKQQSRPVLGNRGTRCDAAGSDSHLLCCEPMSHWSLLLDDG